MSITTAITTIATAANPPALATPAIPANRATSSLGHKLWQVWPTLISGPGIAAPAVAVPGDTITVVTGSRGGRGDSVGGRGARAGGLGSKFPGPF